MPRLGKKAKQEWAYFIGPNGRRQYNLLCRRCKNSCRQSFRAVIVECPKYRSKRENCSKKASIPEETPPIRGGTVSRRVFA